MIKYLYTLISACTCRTYYSVESDMSDTELIVLLILITVSNNNETHNYNNPIHSCKC